LLSLIDSIGYLGTIITMISFVPQVIKSYKTKSVKDLSYLMILATLFSSIIWTIYGYLINSNPLILTNIIFGLTVLVQLYLKIKHN